MQESREGLGVRILDWILTHQENEWCKRNMIKTSWEDLSSLESHMPQNPTALCTSCAHSSLSFLCQHPNNEFPLISFSFTCILILHYGGSCSSAWTLAQGQSQIKHSLCHQYYQKKPQNALSHDLRLFKLFMASIMMMHENHYLINASVDRMKQGGMGNRAIYRSDQDTYTSVSKIRCNQCISQNKNSIEYIMW
jgi:hypothetical protein